MAKVRDIDRGLAAMLKRLAKGATEITVGVHSQDGDEPKKGDEEGGTKLIDVAVAHEFGLGVPRRSYIADWQDENAAEHAKHLRLMGKAIISGGVPNAKVAAERLGARWVGDVQKRIIAHIPPPLDPKTVKRKKSSTPLVDTGQLKSAIAFAVDDKLHPSQNFAQAERKRAAAEKKAAKRKASAKTKARKKAVRDVVKATKKAAKKTVKTAAKTRKRIVKATKKAVSTARKRVAKATKRRKPKAKRK